MENNGVWYIILAAPNKFMGALGLGIKSSTFFGTPLEVDAPIGLGTVFVNTNGCGNCV